MFKKLKEDWAIANTKEKVKYIIIMLALIILSIPCVYYLVTGSQGNTSNWKANNILYSYGLFIIISLISRIDTKPKARKDIEKT